MFGLDSKGTIPETVEERFWQRVDKDTDSDCWIWTGEIYSHGYGMLGHRGESENAHRVSYALHYDEAPDGSFICHTCDNKVCVNPKHLYLGDAKTNVDDFLERGPDNWQADVNSLTAEDVIEARRLYWQKEDLTVEGLAEMYDMSTTGINSMLSGKSWDYLPLFPPYSDEAPSGKEIDVALEDAPQDQISKGGSMPLETVLRLRKRYYEEDVSYADLAESEEPGRSTIGFAVSGKTFDYLPLWPPFSDSPPTDEEVDKALKEARRN